MMKKQRRPLLNKLILSILVVMMLFQTLSPNEVRAADTIKKKMISTLFDILCLPFDGAMQLLQSTLIGVNGDTVIEIEVDNAYKDIVYPLTYTNGEEIDTASGIEGAGISVDTDIGSAFFGSMTSLTSDTGEWSIPCMIYSPELIFSGAVPLFNIDFFSGNTTDPVEPIKILGHEIEGTDSGKILHDVVKNWYNTLRIFSLVALLSILIYAGIKIVFTSVSEQKAKYKEMLKNWVIAFLLIAIFHYLMIAVVGLSKDLSEAISSKFSLIQFTIGTDATGAVEEVLLNSPESGLSPNKETIVSSRFLGLSRYLAGQREWAYLIIYIVLVIYAIKFSWIYLKRVLYIAFLTVIAPLVAFSYPLDKITDGSAEALSFWLKEYIYNVMTQPLHLLIYTIIVGSAVELAEANPIYALVAMGCVSSFEKLVKQILGFNKSQSAPSIGADVGTAALMNSIINQAKKAGSSGKKDDNKGKDKEDTKVRTPRKVDSEYKSRNPFESGGLLSRGKKDESSKEDEEKKDIRDKLITSGETKKTEEAETTTGEGDNPAPSGDEAPDASPAPDSPPTSDTDTQSKDDKNPNGQPEEGQQPAKQPGETASTGAEQPGGPAGDDVSGADTGDDDDGDGDDTPPKQVSEGDTGDSEGETEDSEGDGQPAKTTDGETAEEGDAEEKNGTQSQSTEGVTDKNTLRVGTLIADNISGVGASQPREFSEDEVQKSLMENMGLDAVQAKALAGITAKFLNSNAGKNLQAAIGSGGVLADDAENVQDEQEEALQAATAAQQAAEAMEEQAEQTEVQEAPDESSEDDQAEDIANEVKSKASEQAQAPMDPPPADDAQAATDINKSADDAMDVASAKNEIDKMVDALLTGIDGAGANANNAPATTSVGDTSSSSTEQEEEDTRDEDDNVKLKKGKKPATIKEREKALKSQKKNSMLAADFEVFKQRTKRRIQPAKSVVKGGAKLVGKAPLAAMLGVYGLAAGIATGDPSKAFTLTTGGIIAGGALGGKINSMGINAVRQGIANAKEDRDTYERALYGDNYTDLQNLRADEEFMKSSEIQSLYKENFPMKAGESYPKYVKRLKEYKARALEFRKYGITDDKIIIKAIKLQNKNPNNSNYQGENIYNIASFAAQCPTNEEGMQAFQARLVKGYRKFFSQEESEEKVDIIMEAIMEMRK